MLKGKPVSSVEKIKCKICGSIGYSASRDVCCLRCGNRSHIIIRMDDMPKKETDTDTDHYLQRLTVGNAKPGTLIA